MGSIRTKNLPSKQNLNKRHPFSRTFSSRRMSQDRFDRRVPPQPATRGAR